MLPLEGGDEAEANATAADRAPFRVPKGLWCYRLDRHRVVLGGALTDGGSVFEWLRTTLDLSPGEDMDAVMRQVDEMSPASHGLVVSSCVVRGFGGWFSVLALRACVT